MFPTDVIAWIVVAAGGWVLLNRTRLGRYIIAVGNNSRAAHYSGIPVDWVKVITYSLLGMLVGVAAFTESARYNSVSTGTTGLFLELYAIAAAVIGGSRIEGGVGSIGGAVIGAMLLGIIRNGIVMLNVNSHAQGLAMGVIIIVAALVQRVRARD
jgi:ribose transport system permease protein